MSIEGDQKSVTRPRVDIVMLTFDRSQLIGRAIESIIAQTFEAWELMVVDDGPNPETATMMRGWEQTDGRIRYWKRERPGNIANATNFAIGQGRGEYIAVLDDDDYWSDREKLAKQVAFLDANREYSACGGGVIAVDPDGRPTLKYLKPEQHEKIARGALLANPMAHSTMLYRRSAIEAIGGYDESLAGFQDWDVWLKMARSGKLYNFPEYFTCYTIWSGGGSFQQTTKNTRSALAIVWRHRKQYPKFPTALTLASLYHAYAHLPKFIRARSFGYLSRAKKRLFASGA